jgi:hypothetical protein
MLYYLPHIKLKMDIDVPDGGQPMSTGKEPPAPKVLSDELLAITDCAANHGKFVIVTEPDPTKTVRPMANRCKIPDNHS